MAHSTRKFYGQWIPYSDKSSSIFENSSNDPIMKNSNFPLLITCIVFLLMFVAIGLSYCYCQNVKKKCSKTMSPEKDIQTKPENDSNLAPTNFDLPPAYKPRTKLVELPKTPIFTYS